MFCWLTHSQSIEKFMKKEKLNRVMKFMKIYLFIVILAVISIESNSEGFVEEVACSSNSLTVVLNKTDPDIAKWMKSPVSRPVVYVYDYKSRTPCGVALKRSSGQPIYNFTVPYGPSCGVHLTNLEPNYQTAETTIAIEDNNVTNPSKPMRINHVFCLYTRRVQTLKINDISTCPVKELSEIIEPLQDVNEEVYFTKFQTFRFGEQNTVYAHCSVKVCLTQEECESNCFRRVNSSVTAEKLRLRLKRNAGYHQRIARLARQTESSEVAISNALTILDQEEYFEVAGKDYEMCLDRNLIKIYYIIICLLSGFLLFSMILIGCLTQTHRMCSSVAGSPATSSYDGSLSRRSKLSSHIPTTSTTAALIRENANTVGYGSPPSQVSGTVRSISEISGPSPAWIGSFTDQHSIPRLHQHNIF